MIMRSIFAGIIAMSAAIVVADNAQAQKRGYTQALIVRQQPVEESRDKTFGVGQVHFEEDALTKRIKQDNTRIDRLIDICPSC
jgi:hypothetical protein